MQDKTELVNTFSDFESKFSNFSWISLTLSSTDTLKVSTDTLKDVVDTLEVSVVVPALEWDKHYSKTPKVKPDYLFAPLVFEEYMPIGKATSEEEDHSVMSSLEFDLNDSWLKSSLGNKQKVRDLRYKTMIYIPQSVRYNQKDLPVPPKTYVIAPNPTNRMVTIEEKKYTNIELTNEEQEILDRIKNKNNSIKRVFFRTFSLESTSAVTHKSLSS